ncbi:peptide/nickel transport system ATP-binding protein [Modestobacter sp. DSM 44400]|nr:peptide/nickel transport system ATP-binding protein [Modestobacter sp. DSM 44400]
MLGSQPQTGGGKNAAAASTGRPVLSVRDLSVTFRTEEGSVSAVDSVSFDVEAGEVLAVVGESGCGKSVTAMSLGGLLPRSATVTGSVLLEGTELVGASDRQLRGIRGDDLAYIFQEPMTSLNPVFTVGRQIVEVLRLHQGVSARAAKSRAVELLTLVGIPSPARRVDEYPHQLSGGMRQRVMIAMALACGPKVLIADEPTTALDVTVQAAILDLLRDLGKRLGTAIVLITHDLGVVADIADRVVVMYAGRIVETAPTQELFDAPQHHYTTGLLGAVPTAGRRASDGRLQEIPGLVPVLTVQPDACTFAERCPAASDRCRTSRPPLAPEENPGRTVHRFACWHPAGSEEDR